MASVTQNEQQSLINEIILRGEKAFNPSVQVESRNTHIEAFSSLIENLLVQPDHVCDWLREHLTSSLARLPLREGGVQDTIEFILSVHPSNKNLNLNCLSKNSYVTHEALNAISRLLSSPPATIAADDWFNGIAPQLSRLLLDEGKSEMNKVAAFVIGFGILGRRKYGYPGSSGWKAFIDPIYRHLSPSDFDIKTGTSNKISLDGIEYVRIGKVQTTPHELANSLKSLLALVTSHPHPSLAVRILRPVLYSLWTLSCWNNVNDLINKLYRNPARKLLNTLLHLSTEKQNIFSNTILFNIYELICEKHKDTAMRNWKFSMTEDGIQIEANPSIDQNSTMIDLSGIDTAINYFVQLLTNNPDFNTNVSVLFTSLCFKWLTPISEMDSSLKIMFHKNSIDQLDDDRVRLIELMILQKIMATSPENLVNNSKQLLELSCQILKNSKEFDINDAKEENAISMSLSLLNVIITAPSFRISAEIKPLLETIERALELLNSRNIQEISQTAANLLMLIKLLDIVNPSESHTSSRKTLHMDQNLEDKKSYTLASSYLTAADSPPPVRVQGLEILSTLLEDNSPILDISALITLLTSLLADSEEYVYLRVIRLLVQVSLKHPITTIRNITDRYVDANEEFELDQRLRLGEALNQIIQSNITSIKDETLRSLCHSLLFIGGRRGFRPKTRERQQKARLLDEEQFKEAEEAWGSSLYQIDEELGNIELETSKIALRTLSEWESKRGTEDLRIRSSAITILGTAIKTKIQDMKSKIISAALDMSMHILTLESDAEKAILRRAAVILVMNIIQALDSANVEGLNLGFGLASDGLLDIRRILQYTQKVDNDSLVRQHCRDVIESLELWSFNSLFPLQQTPANIQKMHELPISLTHQNKSDSIKPKVVEVE